MQMPTAANVCCDGVCTLGALSHKNSPDGSASHKLLPGHIPHPLDTLSMGVLALPSRGVLADKRNPEDAPQQAQAAIYHKQALPVEPGDDSWCRCI